MKHTGRGATRSPTIRRTNIVYGANWANGLWRLVTR